MVGQRYAPVLRRQRSHSTRIVFPGHEPARCQHSRRHPYPLSSRAPSPIPRRFTRGKRGLWVLCVLPWRAEGAGGSGSRACGSPARLAFDSLFLTARLENDEYRYLSRCLSVRDRLEIVRDRLHHTKLVDRKLRYLRVFFRRLKSTTYKLKLPELRTVSKVLKMD